MSPVENEPTAPGEPNNPELNPLLNPVLGENMGRWAEVYFTSPPDKRQQAVMDLLSELQGQDQGRKPPDGPPVTPDLTPAENTARTQFPRVLCPACQRENFPGHTFCGFCGVPLVPAVAGQTVATAVEISPALATPVPARADVGRLHDNPAASMNALPGSGRSGWQFIVAAIILAVAGSLTYRNWKISRREPVPVPRVEAQPDTHGSVADTKTSAPLPVPASRNLVRPHRKTSARKTSRRIGPAVPRVQVAESPEGRFVYPASPQAGLAGKVNLKVLIGTDGRVRQVLVLSGNRRLADAAVHAVRLWQYRRHELDGKPAEAETDVSISFLGADAVSIKFPR